MIIVALLGAVLVAYAFGRRIGYQQGLLRGKVEGTIELRKRALVEGHCVICHSPMQKDFAD